MTTVLSIAAISKRFGHTQAIDELSLAVEKGQVYGLLGPNGSGKTTTLGIILGAIHADAGSYQWFDKPPSAHERKRIGSLLEQPNFYPWLSGVRNLKIVAAIRDVPSDTIKPALKLAGLWEHRHTPFNAYSFGMKQRLSLASALMGDPEVLVLDEPTNGVDAQGIAEIRDIIINVTARGKTVILASHILDEVEKVCSHVAILKEGKILDNGPIAEVIQADDIVEIAADDMVSLGKALERFSGIGNFQKDKFPYCISLKSNVTVSELNRFLIDQGITVSHLVQYQSSLESHFLSLLRNDQ